MDGEWTDIDLVRPDGFSKSCIPPSNHGVRWHFSGKQLGVQKELPIEDNSPNIRSHERRRLANANSALPGQRAGPRRAEREVRRTNQDALFAWRHLLQITIRGLVEHSQPPLSLYDLGMVAYCERRGM